MRSNHRQRRSGRRSSVCKGRRPRAASRRRNRLGLWESIQAANQRAHQRSNQRAWKRKGLTSVKAAIAPPNYDEYSLSFPQLILRSLIGLVLLFPCFISTLTLFTVDDLNHSGGSYWHNVLHSSAFLFFGVGSFLMLGWFFSGLFRVYFLYLYVLGHELTHVFFIYLCGGSIPRKGFSVTLGGGGHVITNKSNILIALSPYFIPFWSVVLVLISMLLERCVKIPHHSEALYLLIGASWTFHLTWTLWMLPRDQPDLKENGSFFSLTIIYLANVLLLAGMLSLAPGGLNFKNYCYQWINLSMEHAMLIKEWIYSHLF